MKTNIIFIIVIFFSNTLVANSNISQLLGITAKTDVKKIVVSDTKKRYAKPKRAIVKNSQIDKLLKYTKIKRTPKQDTSYGFKMGYKISKNISVSIDVLAQVDIKESRIKSKETNLQFALSL